MGAYESYASYDQSTVLPGPLDKISTDFVKIVIHERARSAVTAVAERYGNIFELCQWPLGTPTEWCEVEG